MFSIIAAVSNKNGIGNNGSIPWNEPDDMRYFRNVTSNTTDPTKQNALIMGRFTYESLKGRRLPNRKMVIISSNDNNDTGITVYKNLDSALDYLNENKSIEHIFVIGGGKLYSEAIRNNRCLNIYVNKIDTENECDVFFPVIDTDTYEMCSETQISNNILAKHYRNKQFKIN